MSPIYIALSLLCGDQKRQSPARVKYWEIIADKISASGWSCGFSSHICSTGRVLFMADPRRDNGKRFIVRVDKMLTASLELERITRESFRFLNADQFGTILATQPFNRFSLGRTGNRLQDGNRIGDLRRCT
jgi:hypothetical protein